MLKLWVRKWICREASCAQRIFAERFPEVVQRYARMTDRLVKALQAIGVTTNGADAARIALFFGMPTTSKTIIRRVLQLPLPSEGEVAKVGIQETPPPLRRRSRSSSIVDPYLSYLASRWN